MLCSRSASLTSSTRMSSDIASRSLRKFSACSVCEDCSSSLLSLVTPSTRRATSAPNSALDLGDRGAGVLDRVVQQAGRDRGAVELPGRQDAGDLDRVREVGIARGPQLRPVRLHREHVGAVEQLLVGARIVGLDPLDELVLAQHRPPRRRLRGRGLGDRLRRERHRHRLHRSARRRSPARLLLEQRLLVDRQAAARCPDPRSRRPRARSGGPGSTSGWSW